MSVAPARLRAPFPYFGGKSRIAATVWERFGEVPNYVEPFFGSGAMLLARPHAPKTETVNDADGFVSNFWRAVRADPDAVAHWADWPVNENDLHARHLWLVNEGRRHVERLTTDPDYYDAKVAGWWVWGISQWIGSGWCSAAGLSYGHPTPALGDAGMGVHRKLPHVGDAGMGVHRKLPHVGNADEPSRLHLIETMRALHERLRRVRVACGDWSRVVTPSVTDRHGLTAVFLDPPYSHEGRHTGVYRFDDDISADVRRWAIENGDNPLLRIALCGYEGEHEMPDGWETVRWKARGGYAADARALENATRETVWFSPHCLKPARVIDLFAWAETAGG